MYNRVWWRLIGEINRRRYRYSVTSSHNRNPDGLVPAIPVVFVAAITHTASAVINIPFAFSIGSQGSQKCQQQNQCHKNAYSFFHSMPPIDSKKAPYYHDAFRFFQAL